MSELPIIWASEAAEADIQAPSVDKQKTGWVAEIPPYEWFNWLFNRTDKRLAAIEEPWTSAFYRFPANSRTETIQAGARFDLPASYLVGCGNLKVYIDGLLCYPGTDCQYVECGPEGTYSNYIRFNDNIAPKYDIQIEISQKSQEKVSILGSNTTLEEFATAFVSAMNVKQFAAKASIVRQDSPANTRSANFVVGEPYTVPQYINDAANLEVYVNGLLCSPGVEYSEDGEKGMYSTTITWNKEIAIEDSITCKVINVTATAVS